MDASEINATIDSNPGSNFDLVRIKGDVDENTARLIAEAGFDLPGVQVAVEARRDYTYGTLFSQILGYTGPVSADQLPQLKTARATSPTTSSARPGLEAEYETELRGTYGSQNVERDAAGPPDPGPPDRQRTGPRRLAQPDDRHQGAEVRPDRAASGP